MAVSTAQLRDLLMPGLRRMTMDLYKPPSGLYGAYPDAPMWRPATPAIITLAASRNPWPMGGLIIPESNVATTLSTPTFILEPGERMDWDYADDSVVMRTRDAQIIRLSRWEMDLATDMYRGVPRAVAIREYAKAKQKAEAKRKEDGRCLLDLEPRQIDAQTQPIWGRELDL